MGVGPNLEWKLLEASIFDHGDRKIEQMKIETKRTADDYLIMQVESFYFDLTECFNR